MQNNRNMSLFECNFFNPKTNVSNESQKTSLFKFLSPFPVKSNPKVTQKQNLNIDSNLSQTKSDSGLKANDLMSSLKSFRSTNEKKEESNVLKSVENRSESNLKSNSMTDVMTAEEITIESSQLKRRVSQEIERIETWKALTEIEMQKIKDKNLVLNETIEELRQKLRAIQTENNSLKININSEISEREEIVVKMENTRVLFIKVKNYVESIEKRLESFEEIKDLMNRVNDQRRQDFNQLTQKFCSLDINHRNTVSAFEENLNLKESEILKLNEELIKVKNDLNECKLEAENSFNQFERNFNEIKAKKESLHLVINEMKDQLMAKHLETDEFTKKVDEMTQQLADMCRSHESAVNNALLKEEEFQKVRQTLEIELKKLQNECQLLAENKTEFEKRIQDLEQIVDNLNEEKSQLLASKQESDQTIDDLNAKLETVINEKEINETNAEKEKQTLIDNYEKSVQELRTNVEVLEEKTFELTKLKEENQTLIENLESKANESIFEKESIESQLRNEINVLRNEFESKISEFEAQIEELKQKKIENETKINEMLSLNEILKLEKEDLEKKLEREKCSLESQILNMNKILESCKSDYNKRIEDKEERIKELKRDSEKMQYNVEHLSKKCDKIESEKANISRKLQELTLSTIQTTQSSPNRVLTPKSRQRFSYVSPIETRRALSSSSIRSLSPPHVLTQSQVKNKKSSLLEKQDSQKKSMAEQEFNEKKKQINIKSKTDSKSNISKAKQTKKSFDESNSSESVYELLEDKLQKIVKKNDQKKNPIRAQNEKQKPRFKSPVKVNMKSGEENTDEYDIKTVNKDEPKLKKFKDNLFGLKTYSKKDHIRADNILKGRPTPTKDNDLSWLEF